MSTARLEELLDGLGREYQLAAVAAAKCVVIHGLLLDAAAGARRAVVAQAQALQAAESAVLGRPVAMRDLCAPSRLAVTRLMHEAITMGAIARPESGSLWGEFLPRHEAWAEEL